MKFVIIMLVVRGLMALFAEKTAGHTEHAPGEETSGDDAGVHPAEFELRDHYFMRCSD